MSYIGVSDAEKIYPENGVDYLTILQGQQQYKLTQSVPGGYEANILVIRNGAVLRPEADYSVDWSPNDSIYNLLTFLVPLNVSDKIIVIHKGVATYNLEPSPGSVTEDSLAENLRDFICDQFTGNNTLNRFQLGKREYQARSLLVSVNGLIKRPYIDNSHAYDFSLEQINGDTATNIVFTSAPATGTVITVLHLAFSTVLRRSDYLTEVVLSPNIIANQHIQDNAVTGDKLLLNNNEAIRSKDSSSVAQELIKLNTSDQAEILSKVTINSTDLTAKTHNTLDLGTSSKKFKNIYAAGDVSATNVNATSVTASGNVAGAQVNSTGDTHVGADLYVTGNINFPGGVLEVLPIGFGAMWYTESIPAKWLVCNGQSIPAGAQYNTIRAMFPSGFLPDLSQKVALGKKGSQSAQIGVALGEVGGSFTHNHAVPDHNHNLATSAGGNVSLIDYGHAHYAGSVAVVVPSHSHFINEHYHTTQGHNHSVDIYHVHSLALYTDYDGTHNHAASNGGQFVVSGATGTSADIAQTSTKYSRTPITADNGNHRHYINGTTFNGSGGSPNNCSYINSSTFYTSIATAQTSGINSGYWESNGSYNQNAYDRPWNQTKYNNSTNTDPSTMSQQAGVSVTATGATSYGNASVAVAAGSYTANKTALSVNSNVVNESSKNNGPQPYYTVYFIIKAIA